MTGAPAKFRFDLDLGHREERNSVLTESAMAALVGNARAEAVREFATARIATSGFTGRLVVLGDPDRTDGDARLEWVDGGIARDRATLETEIDRRVAAYIASRRTPTTPQSEGTK